jgi:hypothetical protein
VEWHKWVGVLQCCRYAPHSCSSCVAKLLLLLLLLLSCRTPSPLCTAADRPSSAFNSCSRIPLEGARAEGAQQKIAPLSALLASGAAAATLVEHVWSAAQCLPHPRTGCWLSPAAIAAAAYAVALDERERETAPQSLTPAIVMACRCGYRRCASSMKDNEAATCEPSLCSAAAWASIVSGLESHLAQVAAQ